MYNHLLILNLNLSMFIKIIFTSFCLGAVAISESKKLESCVGKCGRSQMSPCSCDVRCVVYTNCCEDLEIVCPDIFSQGRQLFHRQIGADVICLDNYFAVASCPLGKTNDTETNITVEYALDFLDASFSVRKSKQQHFFWQGISKAPITEISTGLNYVNISIFRCFSDNESDAEFWNVQFLVKYFQHLSHLTRFIESVSIYTTPLYSPSNVLTHSQCVQDFLVDHCEKDSNIQYVLGVNQSREIYTTNSEWPKKCSDFFSFVEINKKKFKNKYCVWCQGGRHKHMIHPEVLTKITSRPRRSYVSVAVNKDKLILTYTYGDTRYLREDWRPFGSWRRGICHIHVPFATNDSGCEVLTCSRDYIPRPSGKCAIVYGLAVGFPEDDFPMTQRQLHNLDSLITCVLRSLDWKKETDFEPVVFSYSKRSRRVFLAPVYFYSNNALDFSVDFLDEISLIAKIFKF